MSRVLFLEPVGGIAGDMFLAAAIDLGVDVAALEAPLKTLGVPGWRFALARAERHAITGTHLDVVLDEREAHPHRRYRDIDALVAASGLSPRAKETALRVFRAIGEVEAKIHGVTLDDIHFHEVGGVDSIVDVCGAAVALELLGWPEVFTTPPPLGSGTIRIAHGTVPVPVPATLELLKERPVRFEGRGELTTPTGAALLKELATFAAPPELVVERIGYGVGTKDWPDRANVLRASLGRRSSDTSSTLTVLECNVDDASPQLLGALVQTLLARGALDAWVLPAVMKKGRPGHLVGVLCEPAARALLLEALLSETTSLGVREHAVTRTALERRFDTVETPWGPVRVKVGLRGGVVLNVAPEFEDCRALADARRVPLKDVLQRALAAWYAKG
ncbi:MAG: nickel pincer cofactor biosynthesis protein LarC [Myxococcaceae bacterium]|nr:nickel pincer cofactor biosynthesis protein LarC [Myxococcaceae bacterium]MCA3015346.1 nickel pincer cofactor biosynthesis protein LarC [Myxococcaceae bacterium]